MSVAAQLAQGTKFWIAGSATAAEILTAITVGYPTIIAITGHAGVANGDVVTFAGFTGANAATLNGVQAVVKNYATGGTNDTFAVDINTVGQTITINAGVTTATPLEWVQVKEVKAIKPAGASATVIDVTDLDSTAKEYRSGLMDHGSLSIDVNILEDDPGQAACLAAFSAATANNYKISTPGKTRTFNATCVKWPTISDTSVDGVQTGTAEFRASGTVTVS
jgi:hypothetical protein